MTLSPGAGKKVFQEINSDPDGEEITRQLKGPNYVSSWVHNPLLLEFVRSREGFGGGGDFQGDKGLLVAGKQLPSKLRDRPQIWVVSLVAASQLNVSSPRPAFPRTPPPSPW